MTYKCDEPHFLKDVEDHKATVIRNEGVYRHIRFAQPNTSDMQFDLITWPGHLCYTGDMGTYVFSRTTDMFDFFRMNERDYNHNPNGLSINPRYWSEKLLAADKCDGFMEYSSELFVQRITEYLDECEASDELREAVKEEVLYYADASEFEARQAAEGFDHDGFGFQDVWEMNFQKYNNRFTWCCYALAWGIRKYDELMVAETKAMLEMFDEATPEEIRAGTNSDRKISPMSLRDGGTA